MLGRKSAQEKLSKVESRLLKIEEALAGIDGRLEVARAAREKHIEDATLGDSGDYSTTQNEKDLKAISKIEDERARLLSERGVLQKLEESLRVEVARVDGEALGGSLKKIIQRRADIISDLRPKVSEVVSDLEKIAELTNAIRATKIQIDSLGAVQPQIHAGLKFEASTFVAQVRAVERAVSS